MPLADANPARAGFAWRQFASAVAAKMRADGRGLRALAPEIGVTVTDLSRASSGANVSVEKVLALADWLGRDVHEFYAPPEHIPMKSTCCTSRHVKRGARETGGAAR